VEPEDDPKHEEVPMKRLRKSLKVVGGVVGVVAALELVAVAAWVAGAPTDAVIPVWLGLMLAAAVFAQRRRWLPLLRREAG
jgi:hypothetical protein